MKLKSRLFSIIFLSSAVIAGATASAFAVDDVRVTNWPTQYSVVNTTWDQRLSTLQTTLQTQSANISTLVNRFGWNTTLSFSQGFELLYNDVHGLATSSTNSDTLSFLKSEFDTTGLFANKLRYYIYQSGLAAPFIREYTQDTSVSVSSIDTTTQHIDSDVESIDSKLSTTNTRLNAIQGNTNTMINSWTTPIQNISSKTSLIAVDTSNISVDTEHISGTQDVLVSQSAITMNKVSILQDFFADPQTVALKNDAEPVSNYALSEFTGSNSSSSATRNDYSDISGFSDGLRDSFSSSVSPSYALDVISGNDQSVLGWFSVETYDSLRGGSSNRNVDVRSKSWVSNYPYLEQYYDYVNDFLGSDKR